MKTVIEMARSVGATAYTNRHYQDRPTHTFNVDQLEAFEELIRADERARMAEQPAQCAPAEDGVCEVLDCSNHKPAQQEPYCYTYTENGEEYFAPPTAYVPDDAKPLYDRPPAQRTWAEVAGIKWEGTKLMAKLKERP